ncbi:MAG: transposase [Deltaproteobacteria bacterium]|nr:transposase [Deltaproteobacteria bacterium]
MRLAPDFARGRALTRKNKTGKKQKPRARSRSTSCPSPRAFRRPWARGGRGQKNDTRDAFGLAQALRIGAIERRVFKDARRYRKLRQLARVYRMVVGDVVRVRNRLKSLYRARRMVTVRQQQLCPLPEPNEAMAHRGPNRRLVPALQENADPLSSLPEDPPTVAHRDRPAARERTQRPDRFPRGLRTPNPPAEPKAVRRMSGVPVDGGVRPGHPPP